LRRTGWATLVSIFLCILGLGFLASGKIVSSRREPVRLYPLALQSSETPELTGSGFQENGVYPTTARPPAEEGLHFWGSWIGSDASLGSVRTGWYDARTDARIWVAGYPTRTGISLFAEIIDDGNLETHRLPIRVLDNPGERWTMVDIPFDHIGSKAKFRIVATDNSTKAGGWVGFSTPFVAAKPSLASVLTQLSLVLLASGAAIITFIGPGLLLRRFYLRRFARRLPFIWIPIPGIAYAIFLGLASWAGPVWATGHLISKIGLSVLLAAVLYSLVTDSIYRFTSAGDRKALFICLLLVTIGVAKSMYSVGPVGELYQGTISRTLEVGDRSDSRISYEVVQLIALRERPHHEFADSLFKPYTFGSRGPLAALAASPLVLASDAHIVRAFPQQAWTIFDPEGFMAYRIAMIVLAASCLLLVFGLCESIMSEEWALLAFAAAVSAPFIIHEIYFTWPKIEAAAFFLFAAYFVLRSRFFAAGFALGIGYLFHPAVLLFAPGLIALGVVKQSGSYAKMRSVWNLKSFLYRLSSGAAGLAVWLAFWRLVNRHHFDQGGFINYLWQADIRGFTVRNWIASRVDSILNTFVPLNLFLFHRDHPSVNAIGGGSPAVVSFFFQYWTALPFGVGIVFFGCLLRIGWIASQKARFPLVWLYSVPLLIYVVYWGPTSTGLLRENLHSWVLAVIIGAVFFLQRYATTEQRLFRCFSWALLFRVVDTLAMLILPSAWSQHELFHSDYRLSDMLSLAIMAAAVISLSLFCFRQSESLRKAALARCSLVQQAPSGNASL
jgi:hypothetical protein